LGSLNTLLLGLTKREEKGEDQRSKERSQTTEGVIKRKKRENFKEGSPRQICRNVSGESNSEDEGEKKKKHEVPDISPVTGGKLGLHYSKRLAWGRNMPRHASSWEWHKNASIGYKNVLKGGGRKGEAMKSCEAHLGRTRRTKAKNH